MGTTIKSKEVIAYKGMEYDMTCRGFQYEVGKTYKTDKAELCECGFHACLNPLDVLDYYPKYASSRYFKVKLSREITKCSMWDTNVAATEITILEEITIKGLLNISEWWKHDNVLDLLYFSDGFAMVGRANHQYNYIDKDGKLLLKQWFGWVGNFFNGFAVVRREDNLYNLIDKKGKFLSEEWFEKAFDFNDGFAKLRRTNGLRNFIDKDGKLLSDEWFYWVDNFQEGFAKVQRKDDKWNFIDRQGKLLSDEWFNGAYPFHDGLARVKRKDKWNFIDKKGNYLSDEWFYSVEDFQ